jgi:hypothetical protein
MGRGGSRGVGGACPAALGRMVLFMPLMLLPMVFTRDCSALMMFARAGTRHAGVAVVPVAAVRVAIMPVFKTLDGVCCHSVGSGSAAAAAKAAAVVAAATTIVASAAAAFIASAAAVAIPIKDLGAAAARSAATASLASSAAAWEGAHPVVGDRASCWGVDGIQVPGRSSESAPALR